MSLRSDDCDIRPANMECFYGGNGDIYIRIRELRNDGSVVSACTRISLSGGEAPTDVKIAVGKLAQAMEKHNLNDIDEVEKYGE